MYMDKKAREKEKVRLFNKWGWLLENVSDEHDALNTAQILENSADTMINKGLLVVEDGVVKTSSVGDTVVPKVLFAMIRRTFPELITNKLVSTQPLDGPAGLIFYIAYQYATSKGEVKAGNEYTAWPHDETMDGSISDAGYGTDWPGFSTFYSSEKVGPFEFVLTDTSGTISGTTEATNGFDFPSEISSYILGAQGIELYDTVTGQAVPAKLVTTTPAAAGELQITTAGSSGFKVVANDTTGDFGSGISDSSRTYIMYLFYDQENTEEIPEMTFTIKNMNVKTTERKLKSTWTKESEQDFKAYHQINVEDELVKIMSQEMAYEIDRETLDFIRRMVPTQHKYIYDFTADAATDNNTSGNYLDRHIALAEAILRAAAKIGKHNRQGAGNWIVCSPEIGVILSMLNGFNGVESVKGGMNTAIGMYKLGNYRSKFDIYIDPNGIDEEILIGYKSGNSPYGSGVVYSPYANWASDKLTHPDTFKSIRAFFTRYGINAVPRGQWNYAKIVVSNFDLALAP